MSHFKSKSHPSSQESSVSHFHPSRLHDTKMNDSRIGRIVMAAILISILFTCGLLFLFVNHYSGGGNHSLLFGTELEEYLINYPVISSIFLSFPFFLPVLFNREKKSWILLLFGVCTFLFSLFSINILTD